MRYSGILAQLQFLGYTLLQASNFFGSEKDLAQASLLIGQVCCNLDDLQDQPGCLRFSLETSGRLDLLYPWLADARVHFILKTYLCCQSLMVSFVRLREPLLGYGLQKLHRDWHASNSRSRCELFISLDSVDIHDGAIELQSFDGQSQILLQMNPGDLLIMDSTLLHRGTLNTSGKRRRVIDVQLRSAVSNCQHGVCCII